MKSFSSAPASKQVDCQESNNDVQTPVAGCEFGLWWAKWEVFYKDTTYKIVKYRTLGFWKYI